MALCHVTGTMYLPDGEPATGVRFVLIPSVGGVARRSLGSTAMSPRAFVVKQGGSVDFSAQSGEYILRATSRDLTDTVIMVPDRDSADIADISPVKVPARDSAVVIKPGDSLEVGCIWVDRYHIRQSLVGVDATASMMGPDGSEVDLVVWVSEQPETGEFTVGLPAEQTDELAIGHHRVTVRFSRDGGVSVSSMSFGVYVAGEYE